MFVIKFNVSTWFKLAKVWVIGSHLEQDDIVNARMYEYYFVKLISPRISTAMSILHSVLCWKERDGQF